MTEINGYRLINELSTDNAGFCRWAFCEKNGRQYFIKEFLDPIYPLNATALSPKTIARKQLICDEFFRRKKAFYDTLAKCRSGNIIYVSDFFRYGSKYYAVSEKVGRSEITVSELSRESIDVKKTLICSILYSFAWLHHEGIVHADIKPDNLLIKRTGSGYLTAKIIDFDSGFLVSDVPDEMQGDFVYIAPETYMKLNDPSVPINSKSDIFSLGVLFHQIWTSRLPGTDRSHKYVFEAVLDDCQIGISPSIPNELRDLFGRMLLKDPRERPDATELLHIVQA